MATGASPVSSSRKRKNPKNTSKESISKKRKKKQKQRSSAKSKRRRHDSPDSSSLSASSPLLACSSDSEDRDSRIRKKESSSRGRRKKRVESRKTRGGSKLRKLDVGSAKTRRKKKKKERNRGKDVTSSPSSSSDAGSSRGRRRSRSCSTCRSSSSSPGDWNRGKLDRRGKSTWREKGSGLKKEVKKRDERSQRERYGSPSCSACSGSESRSRERFAEETHATGSREIEGGDGRVEITQDYADCPSSRSNDSFNGVSKWERKAATPVDLTQRASGMKRNSEAGDDRATDGLNGEENDASFAAHEGDVLVYGSGNDPLPSGSQRTEEPCVRVKSMVVVPATETETDDLESILRQKALENLKKFREVSSALKKSPDHQKDEAEQNELCGVSGRRVESQEEDRILEGDIMAATENLSKSVGKRYAVQDGSFQAEYRGKSFENPQNQTDNCNRTEERNSANQVLNNHRIGATHQLSKISTASGSIVRKRQDSPTLQKEQGNHNEDLSKHTAKYEVNKAQVSTSRPSNLDHNAAKNDTSEPKDEGRTDSELKEKMMTVMRGGEMVQVSYKVYIPKKSPALARRQLQQ